MRLTIENIKSWKELLDREAEDKMNVCNFSETEEDADWLFEWSGFTPQDVIRDEIQFNR